MACSRHQRRRLCDSAFLLLLVAMRTWIGHTKVMACVRREDHKAAGHHWALMRLIVHAWQWKTRRRRAVDKPCADEAAARASHVTVERTQEVSDAPSVGGMTPVVSENASVT